MYIDLVELKKIYNYLVDNKNILFINDYVGLEEDNIPTFEDFKNYIKNNIISGLEYDLACVYDMSNLIKED